MGFKKAFKKVRKALGIPAVTLGNVAKVGAAAATGGIGGAALALGGAALKSKLKSAAVGGIKQVIRSKADKVLLKKAMTLGPPKIVASSATTMPGGAPLKGRVKPRRVKAAKLPKLRKAPKIKAPKAAKGPRKPPKGGLDLKALSASWQAAGKPGTWAAWIKANK